MTTNTSPTHEFRRNPVSGTVVLVGHERGKTLEQLRRSKARDWSHFKPEIVSGEKCPFCSNNEKATPAEIVSYRRTGTEPNEPGWWVRVVPNLGPAVNPNFPGELLTEHNVGPYLVSEAYGAHYVIIETPKHTGSLADSDRQQASEVIKMWRDLTNKVSGNRNIKYPFLFQNFGPLAGASMPHCHSQLIALPVIPSRVLNELRGARSYFNEHRACHFCVEIDWEIRVEDRIVQSSENFVAWCPYTSKTPYQVVITPRSHQSYFGNISTHPNADLSFEFSSLLQDVLRRLRQALNDPDYNLYFHTAPANQPDIPYYHWHCQIEPVTSAILAGFEKGSGVFINPRSPEKAAEDLRGISLE